jgi:hypothetical protein
MFNLFRKKDKKEVKEVVSEEIADHPQDKNGVLLGMYCPECGYMEVNEESSILPLEGFAICPNCGADLKRGSFLKTSSGYVFAKNAAKVTKRATGGHYRVKKAGPAVTRSKGNGRLARFHQA